MASSASKIGGKIASEVVFDALPMFAWIGIASYLDSVLFESPVNIIKPPWLGSPALTQRALVYGASDPLVRRQATPQQLREVEAFKAADKLNAAFASWMKTKKNETKQRALLAEMLAFRLQGFDLPQGLNAQIDSVIGMRGSMPPPIAPVAPSPAAPRAPRSSTGAPSTNHVVPTIAESVQSTVDQVQHVALDIQNALVPNQNSAGAQTRIGTSPTSTVAAASAPPNSPTGGALFLFAIPALFLLS